MNKALIDAGYVIQSIDDWEKRIHELLDNIRAWAETRREWVLEQGTVLQRIEHLMKKYSVAPRNLPTLNLYNKKQRISIVPGALWITGANGRINMITNSQLYILIDKGGKDGSPSDWQVTSPDMKFNTEPFNNEAFLAILDDNK